MSESLLLLFTKQWLWANRSCHSLPKSDVICSWFTAFPFLGPRASCSLRSSLCRSFLKRYGSDLLSSLFSKEWLWANRSHCSLQKIDRKKTRICAHWIILCKKLISYKVYQGNDKNEKSHSKIKRSFWKYDSLKRPILYFSSEEARTVDAQPAPWCSKWRGH